MAVRACIEVGFIIEHTRLHHEEKGEVTKAQNMNEYPRSQFIRLSLPISNTHYHDQDQEKVSSIDSEFHYEG